LEEMTYEEKVRFLINKFKECMNDFDLHHNYHTIAFLFEKKLEKELPPEIFNQFDYYQILSAVYQTLKGGLNASKS